MSLVVRPAKKGLAVMVVDDGEVIDTLEIWPNMKGSKEHRPRLDSLIRYSTGICEVRKGLADGSLVDLPPGLRRQVIANIAVRQHAKRIEPIDILME